MRSRSKLGADGGGNIWIAKSPESSLHRGTEVMDKKKARIKVENESEIIAECSKQHKVQEQCSEEASLTQSEWIL